MYQYTRTTGEIYLLNKTKNKRNKTVPTSSFAASPLWFNSNQWNKATEMPARLLAFNLGLDFLNNNGAFGASISSNPFSISNGERTAIVLFFGVLNSKCICLAISLCNTLKTLKVTKLEQPIEKHKNGINN